MGSLARFPATWLQCALSGRSGPVLSLDTRIHQVQLDACAPTTAPNSDNNISRSNLRWVGLTVREAYTAGRRMPRGNVAAAAVAVGCTARTRLYINNAMRPADGGANLATTFHDERVLLNSHENHPLKEYIINRNHCKLNARKITAEMLANDKAN